jgi:hypothetical protein
MLLLGLLLLLIILVLFIYFWCGPVRVYSPINGHSYLVKNGNNKQQVADTFAQLDIKLEKLLAFIKTDHNFLNNNKKLIDNWSRDILVENIFNYGTSLTINKGDLLLMCVGKGSEIQDQNTLMFVLIHEISHIGSFSHGHTPEFIDYFRYLLQQSVSLGIWKYVDYSKNPVQYCGIDIKATPI